MTFIDICFEFNETNYLEAILGIELFEDGIELLKLYIKRRKEYMDIDKYLQDAQTLIQKMSKDEVEILEELIETIEFHSGERTPEQYYNILVDYKDRNFPFKSTQGAPPTPR